MVITAPEEYFYIDLARVNIVSSHDASIEVRPYYPYVREPVSLLDVDEYILDENRDILVERFSKRWYIYDSGHVISNFMLFSLYDHYGQVFRKHIEFRVIHGQGGLEDLLCQGEEVLAAVQERKKVNRFSLSIWRAAATEAYRKNPLCGGRIWFATDSSRVVVGQPYTIVAGAWSFGHWRIAVGRNLVSRPVLTMFHTCTALSDNRYADDIRQRQVFYANANLPRLLSIRMPRLVAAIHARRQHLTRFNSAIVKLVSQYVDHKQLWWFSSNLPDHYYRTVYIRLHNYLFFGIYNVALGDLIVFHPLAPTRGLRFYNICLSTWPCFSWRRVFDSPDFLEQILPLLGLTHDQLETFEQLLASDRHALESIIQLRLI